MSAKRTYIKFGKEAMEENTWVNVEFEVEGVVWEGSEDMGGDEKGRRARVGIVTTDED